MGKLQWGNSQSNASVEETSETETSVRDGDTGTLLKHNSSESEKGKMIFDSWESSAGYPVIIMLPLRERANVSQGC